MQVLERNLKNNDGVCYEVIMFDYTKSLLFKKINEPDIEKMLKCSMASQKQIDGGEAVFSQDD